MRRSPKTIAGRRSERMPAAARHEEQNETMRFCRRRKRSRRAAQGGARRRHRRPSRGWRSRRGDRARGAGYVDEDAEIREAVAQALADAASFRRVRLFAKALESLQTGLELDPMSREVHEAMRDILVETGAYEDAGHVVAIAGMQLEAGEVEAAVHGLYYALSLLPGMKQAEEMLKSLGYELPVYGAPEEPAFEPAASQLPFRGRAGRRSRARRPSRRSPRIR